MQQVFPVLRGRAELRSDGHQKKPEFVESGTVAAGLTGVEQCEI